MTNGDDRVIGVPGAPGVHTDTERLLRGVQDQLHHLDDLTVADQVPVFENMHAALADALARTAETAPPPGRPGA